MQKLVYILPEYNELTDTHFYHTYALLRRVEKSLQLYVVVERGSVPKDIRGYAQKFRSAPLRALELFFVLLNLRLRGYRTFWTHYSFFGANIAPFFGRSFYWNCGMPWLYQRSSREEKFFRRAMRVSRLVTGTEGMKKMYIEQYGLEQNLVYVLPNWIDEKHFETWMGRREEARSRLGILRNAFVVLFVHHLSKRKGADMIVPVARAFEKDPSILFVVAGSGPLAREIRGENIRREGSVPQAEIPLYFAAADIFFMPSEEEGFPHVLLEAMMTGVPIVASAVGGVREIIPEACTPYVTAQNIDLFYKNIQKLFHDEDERRRISEAERQHVKKYTVEKALEQFLTILSSKN